MGKMQYVLINSRGANLWYFGFFISKTRTEIKMMKIIGGSIAIGNIGHG
jgi:hypothetical protein